jgi:hypothetical protein
VALPRGNNGSYAMRLAITGIVVLQAAVIAVFFAAFAASGDSWGIARAVALLLSVPFLVLSMPALVLMWKGHTRTAAMVALLSLVSTWIVWAFA